MARAGRLFKGNGQLFREVVQEFVQEYGGVDRRLAGLARDREWGQIAALAHQLKGLAGNLGADRLAREFTGLEQAAKADEPDGEKISQGVDRCRIAMGEVVAGLSEQAPKPPAPATAAADIDKLAGMVEQMGRLLDQNSLAAKPFSKELRSALADTPWEEAAQRLENQIKRFEFHKAKQTFKQLSQEIGNPHSLAAPTGNQ